MGKGRTLFTSRSERYLGSLDNNHGQETANGAAELGEDEVWSVIDNTENGDDRSENGVWSSRASMESNGSFGTYRSRRRPPPPSDHHRQLGGLSQAFDDSINSTRILHQFRGQDGVGESPSGRHMAASAPVNVPDWSKIYRVDSVESMHELEDGLNDYDPGGGAVVPPHEYLSREYARSRRNAAANSVFEGVGRTLKGRDLSRVRDAVWSQTRFDG